MSDLGLPYVPKTPQVQGRVAEKKRAKERGARLHPMSGAGSIKDDASDEDTIYEFKEANRTHTLNSGDLYSLLIRAMRQSKDGRYVITFANGLVADIHLYTTKMGGPLNG